MSRSANLSIVISLVLIACAVPQNDARAETSAGVSAGIGRSNNIRRTESDEQDETIGSAGVDFSVLEQTSRLYTSALGELQYLHYQSGTYQSEVIGDASGLAQFQIVPERFSWLLQDNFGQVRSDPFAPITPDNRENINYLTTGPDYLIHLSNATNVRLSGRYSWVNYQRSDSDNDRYGGEVALTHDLSNASVASLHLRSETVDYSASGAEGYQHQEASAAYALNASRTELSAEVGYSKLKRDSDDSGGPLVRLSVRRHVSASSTVWLQGGREFTDSSAAFRLEQDLGASSVDTQGVIAQNTAFTNTYGSIGWEFQRLRTAFGLSASTFRERYEHSPTSDRDRGVFNIHVSRQITPFMTFGLSGNYASEEFKNVQGDFHEISGSALLSWQMSRKISATLQFQRFDRAAESPNTDYRENRAWLQFTYGVPAWQLPSSRGPRSQHETGAGS